MKSQIYARAEKSLSFVGLVHIPPFVLFVTVFFYMLGICHGVDDLFWWLFSWPYRAGHDYEVATIAATTVVIIRSIDVGTSATPEVADIDETNSGH